jgi:ATP-dependent Clp protease ATP-binding subunit ClpA
MFERFTDRARRVVVVAQDESRKLGHDYIGTEHILLGILGAGESAAVQALESLGVSLEAARQQVEEIVGRGSHQVSGHIPFTPRAKKVLELSLREAIQLGHNYIGTEHILLGLIREGEGVAAQVLTRLGADLNRTRQQVIELLHGPQAAEAVAEYNRPLRRPGGPGGLDAIRDRLDTIAGQLAAIVSKLGIGGETPPSGPGQPPGPRPAALRRLDERIARTGREKQAAIDAQDFERAVTLRDEEKELVQQRDAEHSRWLAAAGQQPPGADGAEVDRLRQVIDNLQAQLRGHGIEPDPEGKIDSDPEGKGEADPPADAAGS